MELGGSVKMPRLILEWRVACESETQSFSGAMYLKVEVLTSIRRSIQIQI